jgi:hypothetical protein
MFALANSKGYENEMKPPENLHKRTKEASEHQGKSRVVQITI